MKKAKRIAALLTVLVLCFSLCGCVDLDDLRNRRASVTAEGSVVLGDGTEYKPLPVCEDLSPAFDNYEMVYVAEEDVPLLLSFISENRFVKSDDGLFLQSDDMEATLYCRTDVYDSILQRINKGFVGDVYGYWYYDYETDEQLFYTLTSAQAGALSEVFDNQTPELLPEMTMLDYEYMVDLWLGTEDKLFMRDVADVSFLNGKYYVVDYGPDATVVYEVPESLSAVFAEMLAKQVESDSFWEDDWGDDWEEDWEE